jgi:hypothetical protein
MGLKTLDLALKDVLKDTEAADALRDILTQASQLDPSSVQEKGINNG